ncbi:MAG: DUF433 domain-containing protein [Candidatus Binataceae bacterium]
MRSERELNACSPRILLLAARLWNKLFSMKLGVFSAKQVCRLAKISDTQLRYWYKTNVFRPQILDGDHGPFRRVYSFRDVVGLRTISTLRKTYSADLRDLREVEKRLKNTPDADWSNVVFYIGQDGHIYFKEPGTGATVSVSPIGQTSLFQMRRIIQSVEEQLALMNKRTKEQIGKVSQSRHILRNASVVAGTRIPTSAIYDLHKEGFSFSQIIADYPRLSEKDVRAVVEFERVRLAS